MRLTIVTAAWNAEKLPRVIVTSIGCQSFMDWQHIIINDNNPEVRELMENGTFGVHNLKFSEDEFDRRHWIDFKFRTHYYGAIARNTGAMAAFSYVHSSKRDIENEWIVFHDDDNIWEPDHLYSMVKVAEENPEATIVASDARWVGANDKTFNEIHPCKLKHGGCDLGQFMYKTKLFKEYGYFDPHPHSKHKYDWRLIEKMTSGEGDKLVYTGKPTFIMNYKKK